MTASPIALGQFETPLDAADLLLGFSLHRPTDRVLDPSCGSGILLRRAYAWQEWLAPGPHDMGQACWYGVELDALPAAAARREMPQAAILQQNFFTLDPTQLAPFDVVIGNPPYTRAQAIGMIETDEARQMALFPEDAQTAAAGKMPLLTRPLAGALSGRSGLYAYFFLHSAPFLREGGRLAFVVPNGWLDVAYGASLKRFLLEHFRVRAIIESSVERWFASARVNTCLIILEKCGNVQRRRNNLIHLVRLQQEMSSLLPPADDYRRLVAVEQLVAHLSPGRDLVSEEAVVHVLPQKELHAEDKWGIALRAPTAYHQTRSKLSLAPLQHWMKVERGYTTGANAFFYLTPAEAREWSLEKQFRRPLLKSLRGLDRLRLAAEDSQVEVLLIPPDVDLRDTAVSAYIRWGEEQGFQRRTTCAVREPWYSLLPQEPAPLVMPKGIWRRHAVPLLLDGTAVDQQLYQFYPAGEVSLLAAAALLNSAWFALQVELHGRVNFGKGLLWLAAYELEQIRLPDPRRLTFARIAGLEEAVLPLTERALGDCLAELERPDRQALDEQVFDILGFSGQERAEVLQALMERTSSRRRRAQSED
jgi:methylase of polypeptide subunit release factors